MLFRSDYGCDDGDLETKDDLCDGAGGCAGTPYECAPSQCQGASTHNGTDCTIVDHPDDYGCDDGDLETKDDL